jgi:hypothetical protein
MHPTLRGTLWAMPWVAPRPENLATYGGAATYEPGAQECQLLPGVLVQVVATRLHYGARLHPRSCGR